MKCPCCNQRVTASHFACHSGAKGGAAGTGDAKRRKVTSEQSQAMLKARWDKWRKEHGRGN